MASRQPLRLVGTPDFATVLKRQRLSDDLTQAQLAEKLAVRQQTVAGWEGGDRPQPKSLAGLSGYLGIGVNELVQLLDAATLPHATHRNGPLPGATVPDDTSDKDFARRIADTFLNRQTSGLPMTSDETALFKQLFEHYSQLES